MTYQQLRPKKKSQDQTIALPAQEDTRRKVLYTRLSTTGQVLNHAESLPMQLAMAEEEEIASGKIIVVMEGKQADGTVKGVSGRKSIEERDLSKIMAWIYADEIEEVRVLNVSRLFRTKSRVPVETFIDACRDHRVTVRTKTITYDFSIPGHDDLFRMEYNFAR